MALGQHAWCVCQPPNHGDLAAWRPWGLLPWGGWDHRGVGGVVCPHQLLTPHAKKIRTYTRAKPIGQAKPRRHGSHTYLPLNSPGSQQPSTRDTP